jgi:hypothetical protein
LLSGQSMQDLKWTEWHWDRFFWVLEFSPVITIPSQLNIHLCVTWGLDNRPTSDQVPQRHSLTTLQQ